MNKKVLHVGPLSSGHIQKWLENSSHENYVLTLNNHYKDYDEASVIRLPSITKTKLDFFLIIPFYIYYLWKIRPSSVVFYFLSSYALLSLFTLKKSIALCVWGSDVNIPHDGNNFLIKYLIKRALKKANWINSPAQHISDKLVKLGADKSKIETFQYGIDTHKLANLILSTKRLKIKSNLLVDDEGVVRFVSNRNWSALYRVEEIIRAFSHYVVNIDRKSELHLYGGGSKEEEESVLGLVSKLPKLAQEKIVVFGRTNNELMLRQMSSADIYVSIPTRDGLSLSVLEAMYIGLVPVVSDIDANREFVDVECSVFVENAEVQSILSAFEKAAKMCDRHRIWQGNKMIEEKYDLTANSTRFDKLIETLIDS